MLEHFDFLKINDPVESIISNCGLNQEGKSAHQQCILLKLYALYLFYKKGVTNFLDLMEYTKEGILEMQDASEFLILFDPLPYNTSQLKSVFNQMMAEYFSADEIKRELEIESAIKGVKLAIEKAKTHKHPGSLF